MKKVFILYELTSPLLASSCGCDTFEILGVYNSKEKAIEEKINFINMYLKDGYVLDKQDENKEKDNVILFWDYQENWNEYIELIIQEKEIL